MDEETLTAVAEEAAAPQQAESDPLPAAEANTETSTIDDVTAALLRSEGQRRFEAQMGEIRRMDPTVRGLEDLVNTPEFARFDAAIQGGVSLPDAFKLVYFDRATRASAQAARQAGLNQLRATGHLRTSGSGGKAPQGSEIPAAALDFWQEAYPDDSPTQLRARYNQARNHI